MISKIKANVWGQIQISGTYNLYARGFRYINTMPFENHLDINSLKLGDCANHIRSITWLLCELPDGNTYHFKHFKFTQKPTHPPFGSTKSHILKIFNEGESKNEWMNERKKESLCCLTDE